MVALVYSAQVMDCTPCQCPCAINRQEITWGCMHMTMIIICYKVNVPGIDNYFERVLSLCPFNQLGCTVSQYSDSKL